MDIFAKRKQIKKEKESKYYVTKENDSFTLRQKRFKGRKKEHPHDVMATGFKSLKDMRKMRNKYGLY